MFGQKHWLGKKLGFGLKHGCKKCRWRSEGFERYRSTEIVGLALGCVREEPQARKYFLSGKAYNYFFFDKEQTREQKKK